MYKKLITAIVSAAVCISLTGCSMPGLGGGGSSAPAKTQSVKVDLPLKISNEVTANVFIDGTYSMAGYVRPQGSTVFIEAVKGIETVVSGTWRNEKMEYFKFGAADNSIPKMSREQFLKLDQVGFYNTTETVEEIVVDQFDMEKLNIIVTDLFQTDQHLESLILSLKRKCFADDTRGLAIIGLKSQFDGMIYDIGRDKKMTPYKSDSANEDTFRPFYLIVAGKADDVRAFSVRYNEKFSNARSVLFVKNISDPSTLTAEGYTSSSNDANDKAKLMAKLDDINGELNYQYNIKSDGTQGKTNVMVHAGNSFSKVEKYTLDTEEKNFLSGKVLDVKLDKATANIRMELRVNPVGIDYKKGQYKAKFNLLADKQDYVRNADAFNDWNVDDNTAVQDLKGVGSKTLNISKLTTNLANFSHQFNKPGIYDLKVNILAK